MNNNIELIVKITHLNSYIQPENFVNHFAYRIFLVKPCARLKNVVFEKYFNKIFSKLLDAIILFKGMNYEQRIAKQAKNNFLSVKPIQLCVYISYI